MLKKSRMFCVALIVAGIISAFITQRAEAVKNDSGILNLAGLSPTLRLDDQPEAPSAAVPFISEVHPNGSGNGTYAADWFEVTNTGTTSLDITGWKMDDNSNSFASSVPLRGLTSIPAGRSAVFFEGAADGSTDATIRAAFSTAWFGSATPPAGFLIGAYGGSGVGLSGSGDAVNLYNGAGTLMTSVTFGTASATSTFDNTSNLSTVTAISSAGINGAALSANGIETGSPGKRQNSSPITSVDLSTYVRVGRFNLPEPTRTAPPANSVLAQEASGVTYDWDSDSLFVVGDGGTSVVQVTKTGQLIDSMTLSPGGSPQGTEFYDPEGIAYVGNGKFVMTEERDRNVVLFTYAPGTVLTRAQAKTVKLGTFVDNIGLEGVTWDPTTSGYILVKEKTPLGVFQTGIDFDAGTATNGSPTTVNSTNLFDPALANVLDLADVFALSNIPNLTGADSSRLLLLSQESGKIVNIGRNGLVSSTLTIVSDPGNPLSVPDQQHEGVAMDWNGVLYTVAENGGGDFDHPQLWVYQKSLVPNQAPTALALTNKVASILENTSTVSRIKVADVVITDDGLGTNNLTVTGVDASSFEVDSSGLYIKAGTVFDFETKSSYSITVNVDDPTVGATPDASTTYSLTVIDQVIETPPGQSVVISEVSPWASGSSPYATDWFEVTNTGATAVNITGWKMDDNSNAFPLSVALNGITNIAPGESVIFLETADLSTAAAAFKTAWFGANAPVGLQIGSYTGAGVGLSTTADAVNLYNSAGQLQANVVFAASPAGPSFATFNNSAGLNNATISALSAAGVNGAFVALGDPNEIGSPGTVGGLRITEVAPWSSGAAQVGADWFEVTNTSAAAIDITGWKMDDNSQSPAAAVPMAGIASINPGESVIFIETADLPALTTAFRNTWFGANSPTGTRIGSYNGSGVGLSTSGDAVNLYDTANGLRASVSFGASPANAPFATFDNSSRLNNVALAQLSTVGVNGAFAAAADQSEIGSPGRVSGVTANKDSYNTNLNAPLNIPQAAGVLSNDLGSPITVLDHSNPTFGSLTINADGSFSYIPNSGFAGQDTFTYTISDTAQTFRMNNPPLGAFNGVSVGGDSFGSSIAPVPGSPDEYYGLTDRGPNVNGPAGSKVEPIPSFDPAIGKFKLINGVAVSEQVIPLKGPNGEPYNGQVNPLASTAETITDLAGTVLPASPFGYDSEGLVALPDGTFWVSDEYGPFITHFDAAGRQIGRLSPFDSSLPKELAKRLPNRGMEGLTITPDGTKLVGMMQSALVNDITTAQSPNTTVLRIVTYVLATGQVREYLYLLDDPAVNVTAVSEITALSSTTFIVDERDGNFPPNAYKRIYQIDISGATDVGPLSTVPGAVYDANKGLLVNNKTLESLVLGQNTAASRTTLTGSGITAVPKTLKLDLIAATQVLSPTSRVFPHDKFEGMATLNGGGTLVLSNDSDFSIIGVTPNTPPFQLVGKNVPSLGQPDFGEFMILDTTRPTQTSTATVSITVAPAASFEGDINRPGPGFAGFGDGDVNIGDQIQAQRFLSGADCPTAVPNEQQRLDAGPRATNGDGVLGSLDTTAIDAYARHDASTDFNPNAAGWQPTPAGGPTAIGNLGCTPISKPESENVMAAVREPDSISSARVVRVVSGTKDGNYDALVDIKMTAQGNEAGTQYGLHFDPSVLAISSVSGVNTNPDVMLGAGAPAGTTLNVNADDAANGNIGIVENFSAAALTALPEGSTRIARVKFHVLDTAAAGTSRVDFDSSVISGATSDINGFVLSSNYEGGDVSVSSSRGVTVTGRVTSSDGRGIRGATVTIVDGDGFARSVTTSSFGYYTFDDVAAATYTVAASSRQYRYASRVVTVGDNLADVNFTGLE